MPLIYSPEDHHLLKPGTPLYNTHLDARKWDYDIHPRFHHLDNLVDVIYEELDAIYTEIDALGGGGGGGAHALIADHTDASDQAIMTPIGFVLGTLVDWQTNKPVSATYLDFAANLQSKLVFIGYDPVVDTWRPMSAYFLVNQAVDSHIYGNNGFLAAHRSVGFAGKNLLFTEDVVTNWNGVTGTGTGMFQVKSSSRQDFFTTDHIRVNHAMINRNPGSNQLHLGFYGDTFAYASEARIDSDTYIDFYSESGAAGNFNFDARIIRASGTNGDFTMRNIGSGQTIINSNTGPIVLTNTSYVLSDSCFIIGDSSILNSVPFSNSTHFGLHTAWKDPNFLTGAESVVWYIHESSAGEGSFIFAKGADPIAPGLTDKLFEILPTGGLKANKYGSGTYTGTAVYFLGVTATGVITEEAVPTGQNLFTDNLTLVANRIHQLDNFDFHFTGADGEVHIYLTSVPDYSELIVNKTGVYITADDSTDSSLLQVMNTGRINMTASQGIRVNGATSSTVSELRFYEATTNGSSYIGLSASTALAASVSFKLPNADGVSGQFLSTNGTGGLSFAYPEEAIIVACSDEITALTTGTAKVTFRMPYKFSLRAVKASVTTAPTGAVLTVDINENGSTILSTKLTIDISEKTSTTAATPAVISDTGLSDDAEITIDIDTVGSTVAGAGLKVYLIGNRVP
jgi:hypothetical protein